MIHGRPFSVPKAIDLGGEIRFGVYPFLRRTEIEVEAFYFEREIAPMYIIIGIQWNSQCSGILNAVT